MSKNNSNTKPQAKADGATQDDTTKVELTAEEQAAAAAAAGNAGGEGSNNEGGDNAGGEGQAGADGADGADVVIKDLSGDSANAAAVIPATGTAPDSPAVDAAAVAAAAAAGTVKIDPIKEPTFETAPDVVKADKQVNMKGSAATAIIVERIGRHMDFLNSKIRIADEKARNVEQATFIETIGEALKQDYPRFELVADLLMDQVRQNSKLFNSGMAFRFMAPLEKLGYAPEALQGYKAFIQFLITVSKNWKRRHQLADLVDVTYVIEGFPSKARENITQFFNKLASA